MAVFGLNPIGTIIGWHKSATNTPTLAAQGRTEYVECNGQVLSDAASRYNGLTMPSLNSGQTRFLRGGATSGTTAGSTNHTHTISTSTSSYTAGAAAAVCAVSSPTGNQNTQPVQSFDVVWIWRVK